MRSLIADRSEDDLSSSAQRSASVKRHKPGRYSQEVSPYTRPSLLAAIRRKASTTLQEALKWPQAQLSRWMTVTQPEKADILISESPLPQSSALILLPTPPEHCTDLGAPGMVEDATTAQNSLHQLPSPIHSTVRGTTPVADKILEEAPMSDFTPFQPSLSTPSTSPQEQNVVGGSQVQSRSLMKAAGKFMVLQSN